MTDVKVHKIVASVIQIIYVDLDGVLVDFDAGLRQLGLDLPRLLNEDPEKAWAIISKQGVNFWENLPQRKGFLELWKYLSEWNVRILSAHSLDKEICSQGKTLGNHL
jgi:hypothetical protein